MVLVGGMYGGSRFVLDWTRARVRESPIASKRFACEHQIVITEAKVSKAAELPADAEALGFRA